MSHVGKKKRKYKSRYSSAVKKNLAGEIWQVKRQVDKGQKCGMNVHHTSASVLDNCDRGLMRSDSYSSGKWDVRCCKVIQTHVFPFLGISFVFIQIKLYVDSYFILLKLFHKSSFFPTVYCCTHTIIIQQNHSGKANFFCNLSLLQKRDEVLR